MTANPKEVRTDIKLKAMMISSSNLASLQTNKSEQQKRVDRFILSYISRYGKVDLSITELMERVLAK
jgi:hypothetical protein